jgi:hypothetical protein
MAIAFSSTLLLLHGDGANNGTSIVDAMGRTITRYGNVVTSDAQSVFGGTSLYFDGTGYLTTPARDFAFLKADFAVEVFVKTTSSVAQTVFDCYHSSATDTFAVMISAGGKVQFMNYFLNLLSVTSVNTGAWVHIAVVRRSGRIEIYVNGALDASSGFDTSLFPNYSYINVVTVGAFGQNTVAQRFLGYMEDLRVSYLTPVYPGNFTVPSSPLEALPAVNIGVNFQDASVSKLAKGDPSLPKVLPSARNDDMRDRFPYGTWRNPSAPYEFKGRGVITGTVKEKSLPANTPLRRLVRLHREPDGLFVRATWSDTVTGAYSFVGVRPDHKFFVTSFDYTGAYRAVIADNITPTQL